MKKPCNLRVPALFAAALVLGIVFSAVLAFFGLSGIYIFIPVAIAFAACVPLAIIKRGAVKPLIFIFAAIFFLVGALYTYGKYVSFCQSYAPVGELINLSAKVEDIGTTAGGRTYLILSGVKAYDTPISGKVVAYLSENAGAYCRRGYTVSFYTTLEREEFISFGEISYRSVQNVRFYCTVSGGMQAQYRFSLFGEINRAIENALFDNLDGETAAVAYAMLTGNTDAISSGTLQSFRNGGVAHVFAVSGLHIGVIYGALTFICKKARLNRFASAAIRISIILLYAGVCNFSASSVRAVVMCAVSAISSCLYCKYDGLNALSLSAILLLLINPLYLFGVGFVLSFSAMLGIVFISPALRRVFAFLPEKLKSGLAVSLSAQFSTIPAMITSFGSVSAAGVFLNIIFVPLISVLYVILFISTVLGALIPAFAAHVLPIACIPLQSVINLISDCGFENAIFSGEFSDWLFVPFIVIALAVSDKTNFGRKLLPRGATIGISVIAITVSAACIPGNAATKVAFNAGYSGGSMLISSPQGNVLVVTDNYSGIRDYSSADVHSLVVLGGEDNLAVAFSLGMEFGRIYARGSAIQIPQIGLTPITYADDFSACGIKFSYEGSALIAKTQGVTIAVVRENNGDVYGGLIPNADFNLYCYDDGGAVLYTKNVSYGLSTCGETCYTLRRTGVTPSSINPKE